MSKPTETVKVMVRSRPMNSKETNMGKQDFLTF
jgi:hypothetical protein